MTTAVPAARGAGYTWEQIGRAIGTSRQAVWQKYRPLLESLPATVRLPPARHGLWGPPRLVPGDPDALAPE
ncbi:MAG TPA: hypothetical protein VH986_02890 [Acidimicrobiia bacterium]